MDKKWKMAGAALGAGILVLAAVLLFLTPNPLNPFGRPRGGFNRPFGNSNAIPEEGFEKPFGDPNAQLAIIKEALGLPENASEEQVLEALGLPTDASQEQIMEAMQEKGIMPGRMN